MRHWVINTESGMYGIRKLIKNWKQEVVNNFLGAMLLISDIHIYWHVKVWGAPYLGDDNADTRVLAKSHAHILWD